MSDVLLKARLPIVDQQKCSRAYRDQPFVQLTQKQFCAGGDIDRDSCFGDSGGPFQSVVRYRGQLRMVQHGIISFGRRHCAVLGIPGVYTNVAHYIRWILNNIED